MQERVERLSDILLVLERGAKERKKRADTSAHTITVLTLWRERSPGKGSKVVWPGGGGEAQSGIEIGSVAAVEVAGEERRTDAAREEARLNPQPYTLNPQLSTLNLQPSTLHPQP